MAKLRNRIELNKTNKQLCGQLDILCADYKELENKYNAIKHDYELVKDNIKSRLTEDADYFTTQYRLVVSIQPAKTEFKYDIKKILAKYSENEFFNKTFFIEDSAHLLLNVTLTRSLL